jgi:hypothetical protein
MEPICHDPAGIVASKFIPDQHSQESANFVEAITCLAHWLTQHLSVAEISRLSFDFGILYRYQADEMEKGNETGDGNN